MGNKKDLLNKRFHKFVVIKEFGRNKNNNIIWQCLCDCGNKFTALSTEIINTRQSCKECSYKKAGSLKFVDLSGQTFGELLVIERAPNRDTTTMFLCLCSCNCTTLASACYLKNGKTTHCGCKQLRHNHHSRFKGVGEIYSSHLNRIKKQAAARNIEYSVSDEYIWELFLKQDRKCALTGEKISFFDKTASLDRIDSSIGYLEGALQWVHKTINRMKIDLEPTEFLEMCQNVANFNGEFKYKEFDKSIVNKTYLCGVKNNARHRNHEYTLTEEQVWKLYCDQGGVCALSGIPIEIPPANRRKLPNAASIDRIDCTKGYTIDNIQFVHKDVNISRSNLSINEFKSWCKKVAAYAA